jgi:hypothetical protein
LQEEFYPEFAEIRATGFLPNGRPLPFYAHSRVGGIPDSINPLQEQPRPMPVPLTTQGNIDSCDPPLAYTPASSSRHDLNSTSSYIAQVSVQGSGTTYANGPFASPTSTVMQAPSASRASDTLYGGEKAITGYNLNAPCAPKAKETGNPFA